MQIGTFIVAECEAIAILATPIELLPQYRDYDYDCCFDIFDILVMN